ncbi:hypothetical protein VPARA_68120 [Variovorax paradoxus]|uniref:Uncharacterized protein n=1 Tax=Variovorax paradoxus TaxID=34073 RepID=A0A0H2LUD1_VARPD|nr:hypothetical protein VPARA_68120 [Variovorax paradoxus]
MHQLAGLVLRRHVDTAGQVTGRNRFGHLDGTAQRMRDAAHQQPGEHQAQAQRQRTEDDQHQAGAGARLLAALCRGIELYPLRIHHLLHAREVGARGGFETFVEDPVGAFHVARQLGLADFLAGREVGLAKLADLVEHLLLFRRVHLVLDELLQFVRLLDGSSGGWCEVGNQARIAALGDGRGALDTRGGVAQPVGAGTLGLDVLLDHRIDFLAELPQLQHGKHAARERQGEDDADHDGQPLAYGNIAQKHAHDSRKSGKGKHAMRALAVRKVVCAGRFLPGRDGIRQRSFRPGPSRRWTSACRCPPGSASARPACPARSGSRCPAPSPSPAPA